jgi:hypothetical protein
VARLPLTANTEDNKEGLDDYTPIPAGPVIAQITTSGYKQTKAKTGNYLQLIWKVISGKYAGRTLFDNLNLDNPNPIAVEIANKSLNSICQACEKVGVQDSEELHGIPVELTLSVTPATSTQPASNNIKAYKKVDGASALIADNTENRPGETKPTKKLPWE